MGSLKRVAVQCGGSDGEGGQCTITLGNCGGKGPGEFAFDVPAAAKAAGFAVEPPTGSVDGGSIKDVVVKFVPAPSGESVGKWVDFSIGGVLRKGVPPPAAAEGVKFALSVR